MYPAVIRNQISEFEPQKPEVSVDFEFRPGPDQDWSNPELTITGLCSGGEPHSAFHDERAEQKIGDLEARGVTWLGHNAMTVEKGIIERITGNEIPVDRMEDSMLRHYLCNADLTKGVVKTEDEEDESTERGIGYLDLWSMASLYTDLPNWKQCRGSACAGPCPVHDPLAYNATDCIGPDIALPKLKQEMKEKRIPENLYHRLKRLTVMCKEMGEFGIKVDRQLVAQLEADFTARKGTIFPSKWVHKVGKKGQQLKTQELIWDAPFNPRSPKQLLAWFRERGVALESTEKDDIQAAINRLPANVDSEASKWLTNLYDYKDAGKGLSAWTAERYFDKFGMLHPRFITTGASTGRLSSANPNFQNMPRVGWGKKIRAAIIPHDPSLVLAKADYSQLELRMCLWYAGYPVDQIPPDAFTWLVENGDGVFEEAERITQKGWKPRDHAKSVSHGSNYGEGLKVLKGSDLDNARTKRLIDLGALVVHRDWEYHGGVVAFTGINLAERLFGSASWENRAKANKIQSAYFQKFSAIREWQKKVGQDAERGYVSTATGRYLTLHGTPEDKLKTALSAYGQGSGADYVQESMLRLWDAGYLPLAQIHDEILLQFDKATPNSAILEVYSLLTLPSSILPGFKAPMKVSTGPNWLDQTEIGKV